MTRQRFVIIGAAVFAISFVCRFNCFSQAQDGKTIKPSPTLAEAANEAYKSTHDAYETGNATCEDVYQWSRRVMEAEQANGTANSAVANHLERMKSLHEIVTAKWKLGSSDIPKQAVDATNFYMLEAEAMPSR